MLQRPRLIAGGTRHAIGLGLLVAALAAPATVSAKAEQFYRFEEEGTANFTAVEDCGDGTTATTLVSVIGGMEFESPDVDDVNEFVTVRIRGFNCDGEFVNDFGTGPADYTGSASLKDANVSGTVVMRSGAEAVIDVSWTATSGIETTINTTQFPGFVGVFTGREREAVATGTVIVDGETVVDGTTTNARIESLEDRNTTTGAAEEF